MAETKPVRIEWELDTSATIDAVWGLFSDTDRYNRAVGFGYVFKDTPRADGTVERTGQATVFGKTLVWDEMPFEYREKQWYRIRRRFRSGPATDVVVTLRLGKRSHGTSIRYCIDVTPRNLLARPIVTLELKKKTRPAIDRILNAMVASLADPVIAFDPKPPPLTAEASSRISPRRAITSA